MNFLMKTNPVLAKELKLVCRTIHFPIALMVYGGALSFLAMMILHSEVDYYNYRNYTIDYSNLLMIFVVLAIVQLFIGSIVTGILSGSSISSEREKQTLDLMLTAPVSPLNIILGKLGSAMLQMMLFTFCSLPAMSLGFLYGGMRWKSLLVFIAYMFAITFFAGSIGIFCSVKFKKTITSIVVTLLIGVIFYAGTCLPMLLGLLFSYNMNTQTAQLRQMILSCFLFFNPAAGFIISIISNYTSVDMVSIVTDVSSAVGKNNVLYFLFDHFTIVVFFMTILLGIGFIYLAVREQDKVRLKDKKLTKVK
ncbi:MAG: ABC transporter permease [Lachnospiraceae bacterium]